MKVLVHSRSSTIIYRLPIQFNLMLRWRNTKNSAKPRVTKTVNRHNTYPSLFIGGHPLTAQKHASVTS